MLYLYLLLPYYTVAKTAITWKRSKTIFKELCGPPACLSIIPKELVAEPVICPSFNSVVIVLSPSTVSYSLK